MKESKGLSAWQVALLYAVVAGTYIVLSDRLLHWVTSNVDILTRLQTFKGWFYVVVTAVGLLWLLRREFALRDQRENRLRQTEIELRQSQERLHKISDFAPVAIFETNPQGDWKFVSPRLQAITGFSPEDHLGTQWKRMIHEADRDHVVGEIQAAIDAGREWAGEFRIQARDEKVRWLRVRTSPIGSHTGNSLGYIGIVEDVTEQTVARETLQHKEELLRNILNNLPVGVWITDRAGKLVAGNPAGQRLWGDDRWVGLDEPDRFTAWWTATGKPVEAQERALHRALVKGETALNDELEIVDRSGARKTVLDSAVPIRNPGNEVIGAVVVNQDITERKKTEQALRESEAKTRAIFENAAEGIILLDESGRIETLNPAAARIFGYTLAELVGENIRRLIPQEFHAPEAVGGDRAPASILRHLVGQRRDTAGLKNNGESIPIDLAVTEMPVGSGLIYNAIIRDNSERQRAQQDLASSHAMLRALAAHLQFVREEERTRISREIHDELGQAMTGIKMDLAWIINHLPDGSGELRNRAYAMAELVYGTIHTIRRIATELRPGILDNLGLAAALEWQASEFQTRTGIPCRCTTALPEEGLDAETKTAIFRIFQETLTNVARHAHATAVEATAKEFAGQIVLEVQDNGQGMDLSRMTNRQTLGMLGMKERAAMIGGSLNIDSAPQQGTKVTLAVPSKKQLPISKAI